MLRHRTHMQAVFQIATLQYHCVGLLIRKILLFSLEASLVQNTPAISFRTEEDEDRQKMSLACTGCQFRFKS